ncbi:AraC family transcriptional regulator [Lichenifustis flavocetrariae]|uniref:AraC family transcriptional regulator n=1 Tax=Lichenifustis flavocetrariae TaxID=2949735 RepID=A0AA41Z3A7_9HYPH|nr:AraC family transcriptional regulator [Lichenifustis flavocetrariae]MCW6512015.1 AraC family transcriptional regulator [Lichenifustis flavocetrariae]
MRSHTLYLRSSFIPSQSSGTAMDPLSEILAVLKPKSYLTAGVDAGGDWAIRFGSRPGTIKCHAVTAGGCWLAVDGMETPVRLTAGDCIILPSGRSFTLASDLAMTPAQAQDVLAYARPGGMILHNGGGDFAFLGTRFEVDSGKAGALLGTLPPLIHLHEAEDRNALRWCITQMMTEMQAGRPGGTLAARHLAHLMLLQAFRLHLSRQAGDRVGLLYALADPQLGRAIEALHSDPAHRWTLAELASRAGLSRSIFAQRFRERVGETPIGYLAQWRMMLARDRLMAGREPLGTIATALGYVSETAFNTAFRRKTGCSPRRYARQGR